MTEYERGYQAGVDENTRQQAKLDLLQDAMTRMGMLDLNDHTYEGQAFQDLTYPELRELERKVSTAKAILSEMVWEQYKTMMINGG